MPALDLMNLNTMGLRFNYNERIQRGRGLGGLLRAVSSIFKPVLRNAGRVAKKAITSSTGQRVLKSVKRQALESGANIIEDVLSGKNISESAANELKNVKENIKDKSFKAMNAALNNSSVNRKRGLENKNSRSRKRRRTGKNTSRAIF